MALSFSAAIIPTSKLQNKSFTQTQNLRSIVIKCESRPTEGEGEGGASATDGSRLKIGSPIVIVEAPNTIKTAASVPCLRANTNLVKLGDVGRIVSRKPKDVWAVRFTSGTYLIDGKHFKPFDLDE